MDGSVAVVAEDVGLSGGGDLRLSWRVETEVVIAGHVGLALSVRQSYLRRKSTARQPLERLGQSARLAVVGAPLADDDARDLELSAARRDWPAHETALRHRTSARDYGLGGCDSDTCKNNCRPCYDALVAHTFACAVYSYGPPFAALFCMINILPTDSC
jgi:hypothetical protein